MDHSFWKVMLEKDMCLSEMKMWDNLNSLLSAPPLSLSTQQVSMGASCSFFSDSSHHPSWGFITTLLYLYVPQLVSPQPSLSSSSCYSWPWIVSTLISRKTQITAPSTHPASIALPTWTLSRAQFKGWKSSRSGGWTVQHGALTV